MRLFAAAGALLAATTEACMVDGSYSCHCLPGDFYVKQRESYMMYYSLMKSHGYDIKEEITPKPKETSKYAYQEYIPGENPYMGRWKDDTDEVWITPKDAYRLSKRKVAVVDEAIKEIEEDLHVTVEVTGNEQLPAMKTKYSQSFAEKLAALRGIEGFGQATAADFMEPVVVEPVVMEPVVMEPVVMEPVVMEPVAMEAAVMEPAVMDVVVGQTMIGEPEVVEVAMEPEMVDVAMEPEMAKHVGPSPGVEAWTGGPDQMSEAHDPHGHGHSDPQMGYGHQPHGYGHQPHGYGHQPQGYGHQPHGYGQYPGIGAPPHPYGQQPVGFGGPQMGYGHPQMGYGHPQMGYGHAPMGYGY